MIMPGDKPVALVGAGTQGARLAYMWSQLGGSVNLIDQNEQQLEKAQGYIQSLRQASSPGPDGWGKVSTYSASRLSEAVLPAWLILECVPESLELKKKVIKNLNDVASPDTVIASNSSSYTISEIIKDIELDDRSRFLSLHSYWPPETSAIEVMGSEETSPEVISLMMEQCKLHKFMPFQVHKSSTGYIYNRIWAAIKREALLTVAEGVASPEEVDAIFKEVLKTPKGPCEQMDVVGLDVVLDIEEHYAETREGLPQAPRQYLKTMIAEGKLGVKSGRGFYDYGASASKAN
ncbi:3-hydroxyacyl-CoA dehydrogenase [Paraphoma chrysanthemicola]|uniref:3-hydroxyacyl-CoA dehydrogenase n=1 Tax=Paraphoma chrysanthemicola TaxID=798071 RepID=A0A8K0RBZ5_9PLEO|nr:3-hydroxyacyl-CoA dehydrogenase [Paraphoma chrysanthemicola]